MADLPKTCRKVQEMLNAKIEQLVKEGGHG